MENYKVHQYTKSLCWKAYSLNQLGKGENYLYHWRIASYLRWTHFTGTFDGLHHKTISQRIFLSNDLHRTWTMIDGVRCWSNHQWILKVCQTERSNLFSTSQRIHHFLLSQPKWIRPLCLKTLSLWCFSLSSHIRNHQSVTQNNVLIEIGFRSSCSRSWRTFY